MDAFNTKLRKLQEAWQFFESKGVSPLVIVDVQPDYEKYISFDIPSFCEWLNENYKSYGKVIFFWNGPELGMSDEQTIKSWYYDQGLNKKVINSAIWYDKSYAFFRFCMDEQLDERDIIKLVKYMRHNQIYDSRDIDENMWEDLVNTYDLQDARDMLEFAGDAINIPDLMDQLADINSPVYTCGGGVNECLKEVEIALEALDKEVNRIEKWSY